MNNFDESYEDVTLTVGGRRKLADKTQHAKEVTKRARHSGGGKVPAIKCTHTSEKGCCMAELLTGGDLAMNMEKFYASANKVEQDAYLLRLIRVEQPKRLRTKDEDRKRSRNNMSSFFLLTNQGKGHLRVCKATFCSVLGKLAGGWRVPLEGPTSLLSFCYFCLSVLLFPALNDHYGVDVLLFTQTPTQTWHIFGPCDPCRKHFGEHKEARPEARGGRRCTELDERKRNTVVDHIQSFKCKASHYSRKDSPGRKYLPYELSVAKMYRMFREHNHLQFRHQVRNDTLTEYEKKVIAAEFILHHRRQRQFYNIMNRVRDTKTVCFDMMENLVLPRTPTGQAYYSRQLHLHVFGVVVHQTDGSQRKEDIHLFTWHESENGKDSNMIASALWHFLRTVLKDELSIRRELRLFSDSCYGQNKNINVLAMLMAFRKQECPQLKILYTFPIRGHSFLPADRVFGRVEQEIRRNPTILLPDDYLAILSNHGHVHQYGNDWNSLDFKTAASKCLKKARPFKISEVRVMEITDSAVGVKDTYSGEFTKHTILKKGCRWDTFAPEPLPHVSHVKPAKREDTLKLLMELKPPQPVVDSMTGTMRPLVVMALLSTFATAVMRILAVFNPIMN
ncbi:hypothetical protein RRG08_040018 [Elysia crispata]|uniref:DUF7869 domain-containing protein n=1 Tax=Elysia crispata TaxID=231223 RepID=A0AAE0Z7Y2_9GAST|nr:hypothetical protein RRG08_040018 [Elysia crispata]